ncbi:MAG: hypothetical protein J1E36_05730 [Eubacterium sp.]|nr:hypothetical protein [Eubacterium sp.]
MNCASCKEEIQEGARFCNHCLGEQKSEKKEIKFDFKIKEFTSKGEMPYILDDDDDLLDEVNEWLATQSLLIMQIIYKPRERPGLDRMLKSISVIYMPVHENDDIYKIDYFVNRGSEDGIIREDFNKCLEYFSPWLSYSIMKVNYDHLYKTFVTYIVNKTPILTQKYN